MTDTASSPAGAGEAGGKANKVLEKMLDRLYASLLTGPNLNCRPHASRQRFDLSTLSRLKDVSPGAVLKELLGGEKKVKVTAKVAAPSREAAREAMKERELTPEMQKELEAKTQEERAAAQAWLEQTNVIKKIRAIAEDARTYEQDTGVHVLNIGWPLLSLPEGLGKRGGRGASRRILAPIALIPVSVILKPAGTPVVEFACRGEGVDLVKANEALFAWLEQHTQKKMPELFEDDKAEQPWKEICQLVRHVAEALSAALPEAFADGAKMPEELVIRSAPRTDDEAGVQIVNAAVVGLFPTANEGLLRDMQAMIAGDAAMGPAESFVSVEATLAPPDHTEVPDPQVPAAPKLREFAQERLVAPADPCQSRAVRVAREAQGLVIHGPPGTGKSQTITNIIGDHLARGQRVLMVCDKRTALDVVKHRLEALGLGRLIAVVHDPQQDQRDLYMAVRGQLDDLPDLRTNAVAARKLAAVDTELAQIHGELTAYWRGVMLPREDGASFHDLIGRWLSLTGSAEVDEAALAEVPVESMRIHVRDLQENFARGENVGFGDNPWVDAAGISLGDLLATPPGVIRQHITVCADAAGEADILVAPPMPKLVGDLAEEARGRKDVADKLAALVATALPDVMAHWTAKDRGAMERGQQVLGELSPQMELFRARRLDAEFLTTIRGAIPTPAVIAHQLSTLAEYLEATAKWTGIFAFGPKKRAREVVRVYGLTLKRDAAQRVTDFLQGLRARLILRETLAELMAAKATEAAGSMQDDEAIAKAITSHELTLSMLLETLAERAHLKEQVVGVLREPAQCKAVTEALETSAIRALKIARLTELVKTAGLFDAAWWQAREDELRSGASSSSLFASMRDRIATLEDVVRIKTALGKMSPGLREVTAKLLRQQADAGTALAAIERGVISAELSKRIRGDAQLHALDGQRLKTNFDRYRALEIEKRELVRQEIVHQWVSQQKQRLLASTGSRLSALGADLKRRLTTRGERALRLRQVIAVGKTVQGGDPLFDMCPVWMASPETVAEIFDRAPLFDVVIFDEASQCRLEEALPVLTRAKRVVIAGDPKQLPPTRFFESAVASAGDDDINNEQDLFEHQQAEVEDLLGAALNLQIDQSFLDVHYRSQNSDLIEFSNQQFYHARLQAIPGHPDNKSVVSPLTLYRADGVYNDRCNEKEAEQVARIVRDLLRRADPPSIGIACFNLQQRDTIVDALDELAGSDSEFGAKLAAARSRKGAATFEGLFVKNLENVQGDERDHIIISTTYGPDKNGKFYQRFGPLGRVGGGRRLNVLVTRARQEVHLVTSIPAEMYRNLPAIPAGQTAGGGWLLYSYLAYAELLATAYADRNAREEAQREMQAKVPAGNVQVNATKNALQSPFAESLAAALAQGHGVSSDVHWGNDGFCVDVAMRHPLRQDGVTIGVLCDGSRFTLAEDPVEWDMFRTAILEGQGWTLKRIWSPHFFRDAGATITGIATAHHDAATAGPHEDI